MPIIDIEKLPSYIRTNQTIAGLDLGTKTIGIAISDIGKSFANPRPVLQRRKFTQDAVALIDILTKEQVGAVIIGLPLNMDGSYGPQAQSTHSFVQNMQPFTELPFVFWDERWSSMAAEKYLIAQDVSRAKRAKKIDSAAATFILQGALDRIYRLQMQDLSQQID